MWVYSWILFAHGVIAWKECGPARPLPPQQWMYSTSPFCRRASRSLIRFLTLLIADGVRPVSSQLLTSRVIVKNEVGSRTRDTLLHSRDLQVHDWAMQKMQSRPFSVCMCGLWVHHLGKELIQVLVSYARGHLHRPGRSHIPQPCSCMHGILQPVMCFAPGLQAEGEGTPTSGGAVTVDVSIVATAL